MILLNTLVQLKKLVCLFSYIPDDIFKEHRVDHQLRILNKSINSTYKKEKAIPSIIGIDIDPIKKKYPIHEPYIVLCPTNSHVGNINHRGYRSWPEKNWRDLIQRIIDDTSLNILLVGSKDEQRIF